MSEFAKVVEARADSTDHPGFQANPFGFDVIDTRDGETLAWRPRASTAHTIAEEINHVYTICAPAHDTLVHEIIGWRISGRSSLGEPINA